MPDMANPFEWVFEMVEVSLRPFLRIVLLNGCSDLGEPSIYGLLDVVMLSRNILRRLGASQRHGKVEHHSKSVFRAKRWWPPSLPSISNGVIRPPMMVRNPPRSSVDLPNCRRCAWYRLRNAQKPVSQMR